MSQSSNKEFAMAVGTSSMLEPNMMEGENFYTPMETSTQPEPEPEPEQATQNNWSNVKNDTGQLCRACANTSDYLIPIFEGEGLEHQLETKITKHLPIQVTATDTLPLQLCYQCASTLIAWDTMINSCIEADKKLRAMQEAAGEEIKDTDDFDSSHIDNDTIDSDDEPLITSKAKLAEKKKVPIKKKILSKAKSKNLTVKNDKTASDSKEGEEKERLSNDRKTGRKVEFPKEMESISIISTNGSLKKIYRCKLCGHITNRSNNLKSHIEIHKKFLPYSCEKCGKKYKTNVTEQRNDGMEIVMDCTNGTRKLYRCKICGHTSNRSNNLKKHLKSHESVTEIVCGSCGVKCRQESVNYHVKEIETVVSHDENGKTRKTFRCKLCSKTFPRKTGLRSHLITHKPINLSICKVCGKEYLNEKTLKEHVTNVHGESTDLRQLPYKCEYCDQLFADKGLCEEHRQVHVGERPYICSVCGCAFRTQSSLYLHSKSHLNNEELVQSVAD